MELSVETKVSSMSKKKKRKDGKGSQPPALAAAGRPSSNNDGGVTGNVALAIFVSGALNVRMNELFVHFYHVHFTTSTAFSIIEHCH